MLCGWKLGREIQELWCRSTSGRSLSDSPSYPGSKARPLIVLVSIRLMILDGRQHTTVTRQRLSKRMQANKHTILQP